MSPAANMVDGAVPGQCIASVRRGARRQREGMPPQTADDSWRVPCGRDPHTVGKG